MEAQVRTSRAEQSAAQRQHQLIKAQDRTGQDSTSTSTSTSTAQHSTAQHQQSRAQHSINSCTV